MRNTVCSNAGRRAGGESGEAIGKTKKRRNAWFPGRVCRDLGRARCTAVFQRPKRHDFQTLLGEIRSKYSCKFFACTVLHHPPFFFFKLQENKSTLIYYHRMESQDSSDTDSKVSENEWFEIDQGIEYDSKLLSTSGWLSRQSSRASSQRRGSNHSNEGDDSAPICVDQPVESSLITGASLPVDESWVKDASWHTAPPSVGTTGSLQTAVGVEKTPSKDGLWTTSSVNIEMTSSSPQTQEADISTTKVSGTKRTFHNSPPTEDARFGGRGEDLLSISSPAAVHGKGSVNNDEDDGAAAHADADVDEDNSNNDQSRFQSSDITPVAEKLNIESGRVLTRRAKAALLEMEETVSPPSRQQPSLSTDKPASRGKKQNTSSCAPTRPEAVAKEERGEEHQQVRRAPVASSPKRSRTSSGAAVSSVANIAAAPSVPVGASHANRAEKGRHVITEYSLPILRGNTRTTAAAAATTVPPSGCDSHKDSEKEDEIEDEEKQEKHKQSHISVTSSPKRPRSSSIVAGATSTASGEASYAAVAAGDGGGASYAAAVAYADSSADCLHSLLDDPNTSCLSDSDTQKAAICLHLFGANDSDLKYVKVDMNHIERTNINWEGVNYSRDRAGNHHRCRLLLPKRGGQVSLYVYNYDNGFFNKIIKGVEPVTLANININMHRSSTGTLLHAFAFYKANERSDMSQPWRNALNFICDKSKTSATEKLACVISGLLCCSNVPLYPLVLRNFAVQHSGDYISGGYSSSISSSSRSSTSPTMLSGPCYSVVVIVGLLGIVEQRRCKGTISAHTASDFYDQSLTGDFSYDELLRSVKAWNREYFISAGYSIDCIDTVLAGLQLLVQRNIDRAQLAWIEAVRFASEPLFRTTGSGLSAYSKTASALADANTNPETYFEVTNDFPWNEHNRGFVLAMFACAPNANSRLVLTTNIMRNPVLLGFDDSVDHLIAIVNAFSSIDALTSIAQSLRTSEEEESMGTAKKPKSAGGDSRTGMWNYSSLSHSTSVSRNITKLREAIKKKFLEILRSGDVSLKQAKTISTETLNFYALDEKDVVCGVFKSLIGSTRDETRQMALAFIYQTSLVKFVSFETLRTCALPIDWMKALVVKPRTDDITRAIESCQCDLLLADIFSVAREALRILGNAHEQLHTGSSSTNSGSLSATHGDGKKSRRGGGRTHGPNELGSTDSDNSLTYVHTFIDVFDAYYCTHLPHIAWILSARRLVADCFSSSICPPLLLDFIMRSSRTAIKAYVGTSSTDTINTGSAGNKWRQVLLNIDMPIVDSIQLSAPHRDKLRALINHLFAQFHTLLGLGHNGPMIGLAEMTEQLQTPVDCFEEVAEYSSFLVFLARERDGYESNQPPHVYLEDIRVMMQRVCNTIVSPLLNGSMPCGIFLKLVHSSRALPGLSQWTQPLLELVQCSSEDVDFGQRELEDRLKATDAFDDDTNTLEEFLCIVRYNLPVSDTDEDDDSSADGGDAADGADASINDIIIGCDAKTSIDDRIVQLEACVVLLKTIIDSKATLPLSSFSERTILGCFEPILTLAKLVTSMKKSKIFLSSLRCSLALNYSESTLFQDVDEQQDVCKEFVLFCIKAVEAAVDEYSAAIYKVVSVDKALAHDIDAIWTNKVVFEDEHEALQNLLQLLPSNERKGTKQRPLLTANMLRNVAPTLVNFGAFRTHASHARNLLNAKILMNRIALLGSTSIEGDEEVENNKTLASAPENFLESDATSSWVRLTNLSKLELTPDSKMTVSELSSHVHEFQQRAYASIGHNAMKYYTDVMAVVEEIAHSEELLTFIQELKDDSAVNFLDMVEEHSESTIRAETITEFDTVRRFVKCIIDPVVGGETPLFSPPMQWLQNVSRACQNNEIFGGYNRIAAKIYASRKQCQALRDTFYSVARREESTKKLVLDILATGHIVWCRSEESEFHLVLLFGKRVSSERCRNVTSFKKPLLIDLTIPDKLGKDAASASTGTVSIDDQPDVFEAAAVNDTAAEPCRFSGRRRGQQRRGRKSSAAVDPKSTTSIPEAAKKHSGASSSSISVHELVERREQSSLEELKSRALLLVNSVAKGEHLASAQELEQFKQDKKKFNEFIELVNQVSDISQLLKNMMMMGHFACNIPLLKAAFNREELSALQLKFTTLQKEWEVALRDLRLRCGALNFFFSQQLWTIHDYIRGYSSAYGTTDRRLAWECLQFIARSSSSSSTSVRLNNDPFSSFFAGTGTDLTAKCLAKAMSLLRVFKYEGVQHKIARLRGSIDKFSEVGVGSPEIKRLYIVASALLLCSEETLNVDDDDDDDDGKDIDRYKDDSGGAATESKSCDMATAAVSQRVVAPGDPLLLGSDLTKYARSGALFSFAEYDNDSLLLPMLFSAFGGDTFERHQLLICEPGMEAEEIVVFLLRVTAANATKACSFAVINSHSLPDSGRSSLVQAINFAKAHRHPQNVNKVVFLVRSSFTSYIEGMRCLSRCTIAPVLGEQAMCTLLRSIAPNVRVISSSAAGMGKTTRCRAIAREIFGKNDLHTVLVTDGITRAQLANEIDQCSRDISSKSCLHLDISGVVNEDQIQLGLLELLIFGTSQNGTSVVHWPVCADCVIEVSSASNNNGKGFTGKDSVNLIRYLPREHLEWNLQTFQANTDLSSDAQIVFNYLKSLHSGQLHTQEFVYPEQAYLHSRDVTLTVVSSEEARALLQAYFCTFFIETTPPSTNVICAFLKVLAAQLREFSRSPHFNVDCMQYGGTDLKNRSRVVRQLVESCRDFVSRSLVGVRFRQGLNESLGTTIVLGDDEVADDDNGGVLRWEAHDQLMFAIYDGCLTPLYRAPDRVPKEIKDWIMLQSGSRGHELPDYFRMTTNELRRQLSNFCGLPRTFTQCDNYVLTPDNFLKITMMLIRVQARIPVIIMGEAGCGKTSLINFAAAISGANMPPPFPVHAGVTVDDVEHFVRREIDNHMAIVVPDGENSDTSARRRPLWLFFDEINTCDHLGYLNAIICHRFVKNVYIPDDVYFFAACNPYKRMTREQLDSIVGLRVAKGYHVTDNLVYRVKPLPQTMLDFVWDFGSLQKEDELRYIKAYLSDLPDLDVNAALVSESHCFIREKYGLSAVSMRDLRRVKILLKWFTEHEIKTKSVCGTWSPLILALAHCFRCRLPDDNLRRAYDERLVKVFKSTKSFCRMTADDIRDRIESEQEAYLRYMNLGKGIAMNHSLMENVFVLLICILNRLPVFLVGKPGSSKSLSITLIASNLRGKDSDHPFFRRLPELKVVSFQGSESSTSDGIHKIFKKAEDIVDATVAEENAAQQAESEDDSQQENRGASESSGKTPVRMARNKVIPLVLLDEVGLAEISPFNPLKVLHSKLETRDDSLLNIAVIGISNWSLDASKMSRAIQLSRPDPTSRELLVTALKIIQSIVGFKKLAVSLQEMIRTFCVCFAKFCGAQNRTVHAHFHGLRDFYSFFKQMGHKLLEQGRWRTVDVCESMRRNFGGLSFPTLETSAFADYFRCLEDRYEHESLPTCTKLIHANLQDNFSRHLMIITNGDTLLNVVGSFLDQSGIDTHRIVIGSKFREDDSENYRYQILSEIILSMEKGESLVLCDLETIYGSLYDMLNQNYSIVAGKKNCRIALGAYSNPMAHVHDNFKCVVVADESKAYKLDPPFLNRFEKQLCEFSSLLTANQSGMVKALLKWVDAVCQQQWVSSADSWNIRDTFVGYAGEDSLSSLVYSLPVDTTLYDAKLALVSICTFHGVVRMFNYTQCGSNDLVETQRLCRAFFEDRKRICLANTLRHIILQSEKNTKTVVTTFSEYYFLEETEGSIVKDLSSFGSQRALSDFVREFYNGDSTALTGERLRSVNGGGSNSTSISTIGCADMLIIRCNKKDMDLLLLTKFIIDQESRVVEVAAARAECGVEGHITMQEEEEETTVGGVDTVLPPKKHVVLVLTVQAELFDEDRIGAFKVFFSSGWTNTHIDNVENDERSWESIVAILHEKTTLSQYLAFENMVANIIVDPMAYVTNFIYDHDCGGASATQLAAFTNRIEQLRTHPVLRELVLKKAIQYMNSHAHASFSPSSPFPRDQQFVAPVEGTGTVFLFHDENWLFYVACNKEQIHLSSSFAGAVEQFVREVLKAPIIKAVYLLEKYSAINAYTQIGTSEVTKRIFSDIFLSHPELSLDRVKGESWKIDFHVPDLKFPFSALIADSIEAQFKGKYLEDLLDVDSANRDQDTVRAGYEVRLREKLLQFVAHSSSVPVEELSQELQALFFADILQRFVTSNFNLSQQSRGAVSAIKSLISRLHSIEATESSVSIEAVQLHLWENNQLLINAAKLSLYPIDGTGTFIRVPSAEEIHSHAKMCHIIVNVSDSVMSVRLVIEQLICNFCTTAVSLCTDNPSAEAILNWNHRIGDYYLVMNELCRDCGLNWQAIDICDTSYASLACLYADLVPNINKVRVFMDIAEFLVQCVDMDNKEVVRRVDLALQTHFAPQQREQEQQKNLSSHENSSSSMDFKSTSTSGAPAILQQSMQFLKNVSTDPCIGVSKHDTTHYIFKILERFMVQCEVTNGVLVLRRYAGDDATDSRDAAEEDWNEDEFRLKVDQEQIMSGTYRVITETLCEHSELPPLSCCALLSRVMGMLQGIIFGAETARGYFDFESLQSFDDVMKSCDRLKIFSNLFHDDVRDSLLEVAMSDALLRCLVGAMENSSLFYDSEDEISDGNIKSLCSTFLALLTRWNSSAASFNDASLVERVYGLAFIKYFTGEAHRLTTRHGMKCVYDTLNKALDFTNIAVRPDSREKVSQKLVCSYITLYFLKLHGKPIGELAVLCGEGGALGHKLPFLRTNFQWTTAEDLTMLSPLPVLSPSTRLELTEAWDGLYDQQCVIEPSPDKFKELLCRDDVPLYAAIIIAFLKQCRSATAPKAHGALEPAALLKVYSDVTHAKELHHACELVVKRFPVLPLPHYSVDDVCILTAVTSLFVCCDVERTLFMPTTGLFGRYIHDPKSIANSFMVGAIGDELSMVMGTLAGVKFYKCECSYKYAIGECGQPMESRSCPDCGKPLGGANHAFHSSNKQVAVTAEGDNPGYTFSTSADILSMKSYTERDMSPNEYRTIAFLVHCCFLAGIFLHGNAKGHATVLGVEGGDVDGTIAKCWIQLNGHWTVLKERLDSNGKPEQVCAFMLKVLQRLKAADESLAPSPINTVQERSLVEQRVCGIIRPLFEDYKAVAAKAVEEFYAGSADGRTPLEKALLEVDTPKHAIGRYLRITKEPTFDEMVHAFNDKFSNATDYPIIATFLKFEHNLNRINRILPLVTWTNAVRNTLNFSISLEDASKPVTEFLRDRRAATAATATQNLTRESFIDFANAWNAIYARGTEVEFDESLYAKYFNLDCHRFLLPGKMDSSQPLVLSCTRLKRGCPGSEVPYMIQGLGQIQNAFLTEVFAFGKEKKVTQLQFAGAKTKKLQNVVKGDLISYDRQDLWEKVAQFTRSRLEYGAGYIIECDWAKIQRQLINELVVRKCFLVDNIWKPQSAFTEFRFNNELFADKKNLWGDIDELIPQSADVPNAGALRAELRREEPAFISQRLMPAIQALLFVLQRQAADGSRDSTLAEQTMLTFTQLHLDRSTNETLANLHRKESKLVAVQLKHIEVLYELLEDCISDVILYGIDQKYRQPLPSDFDKSVITTKLATVVGSLDVLESCWKRFILRYLRSTEYELKPDWRFLHYYIVELIRWPKNINMTEEIDQNALLKTLFNDLKVSQSYSVLDIIHDAMNQRAQMQRALTAVYNSTTCAVPPQSSSTFPSTSWQEEEELASRTSSGGVSTYTGKGGSSAPAVRKRPPRPRQSTV